MSPTLPPAQIPRKRTSDSLNRLVLTIRSSAIQVRKSPRPTVWCMKDGQSLNAGRFTLEKTENFFMLTGRSKPQRPVQMRLLV